MTFGNSAFGKSVVLNNSKTDKSFKASDRQIWSFYGSVSQPFRVRVILTNKMLKVEHLGQCFSNGVLYKIFEKF